MYVRTEWTGLQQVHRVEEGSALQAWVWCFVRNRRGVLTITKKGLTYIKSPNRFFAAPFLYFRNTLYLGEDMSRMLSAVTLLKLVRSTLSKRLTQWQTNYTDELPRVRMKRNKREYALCSVCTILMLPVPAPPREVGFVSAYFCKGSPLSQYFAHIDKVGQWKAVSTCKKKKKRGRERGKNGSKTLWYQVELCLSLKETLFVGVSKMQPVSGPRIVSACSNSELAKYRKACFDSATFPLMFCDYFVAINCSILTSYTVTVVYGWSVLKVCYWTFQRVVVDVRVSPL